MSRVVLRPWEELGPFARLVLDYLYSFRPTKSVSDLARETGIAKQTIWDWLHYDRVPRRQTVDLLAKRTGLDRAALYAAAGHRLPRPPLSATEEAVEVLARLPEEELLRVLAHLHRLVEAVEPPAADDEPVDPPPRALRHALQVAPSAELPVRVARLSAAAR